MERKVYLKLTPLAEARSLWLSRFSASPLGTEEVPLAQAKGRVTAEAVAARLSSPAFHGAAMDGIAVRAEDTFGASEASPVTLKEGETAFWINTGRPLPPNTDAVIMVEQVIHGEGRELIVEQAAFPQQHVRKLGEDMVATEILLPPGTVIGAYELGALAAAGVLRPVVFRRPVVAVLPTGSELVPLAEASPELLESGKKLPEFNSLVLSALIEDAGGEAQVLPIAPDDLESIAKALSEAAQSDADLIVVNAGSSAGSADYTAHLIESIGELWVHGVSIMPGKPTVLGRIMGKPVIGVPGYPVSAVIAFEEFGQSLLAQWQDRRMPPKPQAECFPFQALPSRPGMEERVRVKLGEVEGRLIALPLPRGAGTVTSLSRADGIISIAADAEGLAAGRPVKAALIRSPEQLSGALLAVGSHDNTLDLLDSFLRKANPKYSLTSAHVGSSGGLKAVREGLCHLAGTHLLDEATGIYNRRYIEEQLAGVPVTLMRLVDREQGLIVPRGNPQGLAGITDLARPGLRFINRQRGSGTRVLLDYELARLGIKPSVLSGYDEEEYTHMNVAAAVLSGKADAGLGVRAAAEALALDFIPVGVEEYDLVIPVRYMEDPRMAALLDVVRGEAFKRAAAALGGYGVERTGEAVWEFAG